MFEILTNPVTLLCLGVMFLLISVLFFYFRRSFSVLERAQMEQARILQSFITNMEMSQQMAHQRHVDGNMNTAFDANNINEQIITGSSDSIYPVEQKLIDVSDESESDSDIEVESDDDD